MKNIDDFLQKRYEKVTKSYSQNKILGTFLHGSQNYQLDTEDSDIDSRTILLPSIKDIVTNKKPLSKTHSDSSGCHDHIDIKDIRLFFQEIWKQNVNSLEILFTDYFFLNDCDDCKWFWTKILLLRERIAKYNMHRALKSVVGLAHRKRSFLTKSTENTEQEIKESGYRSKELYHLFRLSDFVEKYTKGFPYKECLVPYDKDRIIRIKQKHVFPKDKVESVADSFLEMIKCRSDFFMKDNEEVVDEDVKNIVEDLLEEFFLKKIFLFEESSCE